MFARDVRISEIESKTLATNLLKHGAKNTIVQLATGLKVSILRKIRFELGLGGEKDGNERYKGSLRNAYCIVNTRRRMIDGGLFLSTYIGMAERPMHQVDWEALIDAFELYIEMHANVYMRQDDALNINECYVLARDYRSEQNLVYLNNCRCGSDYIVVAEQRLSATCPICSMKEGFRVRSEEGCDHSGTITE